MADANGNLSEFFYDGFDRLTKTQFPSPGSIGISNPADFEAFTYDSNGNVLTKRTRAGDIITNTYDALNRILSKAPGADPAVQYFYDARGRQVEVRFADASQHVKHTYDAAGRIAATETKLPGNVTKTLAYQYDATGNRTRITHPDSRSFDYAYDQSSRMTLVARGASEMAAYSYDQLGRRATLVLSHRSAASNTVTYAYEADSALDALAHQLGGSANDVTWLFDYNKANQVVLRTLDNTLYQYNPQASKTESYAANGLNQYTTVVRDAVPASLTYDANGNLTGDGVWAYAYDVENRLLSATDGSTTAAYTYDPLGRRVKKTVNGAVTLYLSDGAEEILELNASGTITRRFAHGPGVDEPVVMWEGSGVANSSRRFYRADHQGSIVALTDQDGNLAERFTYDAWGAPENPGGQPIRYTGRRWDAETGLYYYRARYYSPALGRFLQTDPVGYEPDNNLYTYVDNDPLNNTDPTGLVPPDRFDPNTDFASQAGRVAFENPDEALTNLQILSVAIPGSLALRGAVLGIHSLTRALSGANVASKATTVARTIEKLSKVQRSVRTEKIGDKFTRKVKTEPGRDPGQSRSEMNIIRNEEGKVIRTFKDSFDRANKFQGREPLRGGPEGRRPDGTMPGKEARAKIGGTVGVTGRVGSNNIRQNNLCVDDPTRRGC